MEGIWRRLGSQFSGRTTWVLGVVIVISVALAPGITTLEFATGQDSFLNDDSRIAQENEAFQSLFGGETMIVLFTAEEGNTIADFFTESNVEQLAEIEEELRARDEIFGVISPATALEWTENLALGPGQDILARAVERETDQAAIDARNLSTQISLLRIAAAGEQTLSNQDWAEFLLFDNSGFELAEDGASVVPREEQPIRRALLGFIPNDQTALLAAVLPGNASLDQLGDGEEAVREAFEGRTFENVEVTITGTPTFLNDINDSLRGDMLNLGGIALIVMAVVLFLVFRVRWRLLPLFVMLIGVYWAFAVMGLIGLDLSLVTISGLPILIGIGVDFAIQIHNRVEEECAGDGASPFEVTAAKVGPPLAVATVAAAASFLAMQVSQVPMIRDFGILLAIGIVMLFLVGVAVPLSVLGARERRRPTTDFRTTGVISRAVVWLGSAPKALVPIFVVLAIGLPVGGLLVEGELEIESDPINWADQNSDVIQDARRFEQETGFATTLGVYVQTEGEEANGIFTDEMAAFMHDFIVDELERPELAEVSSLATTVSFLADVEGATQLAPTGEDMLAAFEVAPPDIQRLLVADNGNAAQLNFRVGPSALEERAEVFSDLERAIENAPEGRAAIPENSFATPSGLAVVGTGLLDNLTTNRATLTIVALLAVGVWLLLRYGSFVRTLMAIIPVTIAVGLSALVVAALGITLSPLTTVSGPLVIAACVEFTILLLRRYVEEREAGLEPREATDAASSHTGRAFTASALTTLGGFAVIISSPLPLLSDFGQIVTLNIFIALISALVVLPPVMVWADGRGWLGLGAHGERRTLVIDRIATAGVAAALAVLATVLVIDAVDQPEDELAIGTTVPAGEIAELATPTPTPEATPEPTPTEEAGENGDAESEEPESEFLPPGVPERPDGLVAGGVWDAYTEAGADPGVARCLTDYLLSDLTTEEELLALGIVTGEPEARDLVAQAAEACGVPQDIRDAVAASN